MDQQLSDFRSRVARETAEPLAAVAEAIGRLKYGAIVLTLHDGKVVQMEVTERQRFT